MCASQCYIVTLPNGIDRRHVVSHLFVCSDWSWLSSVLEQVFDSTREITRSSSKIKYQHLYRHADSSVAAESNMVFYYQSSWLKGVNSLGLAYHYSSIKNNLFLGLCWIVLGALWWPSPVQIIVSSIPDMEVPLNCCCQVNVSQMTCIHLSCSWDFFTCYWYWNPVIDNLFKHGPLSSTELFCSFAFFISIHLRPLTN